MSAYNFPLPVKRPCEFFLPNFPPFFASLLDPIKEKLVNCDRLASHSGGGEGIKLLDWKWVIVSVFQAFRTSNPEGQPPPDPIQSHLTVWLISVPPPPPLHPNRVDVPALYFRLFSKLLPTLFILWNITKNLGNGLTANLRLLSHTTVGKGRSLVRTTIEPRARFWWRATLICYAFIRFIAFLSLSL